jgi:hypothetical protein
MLQTMLKEEEDVLELVCELLGNKESWKLTVITSEPHVPAFRQLYEELPDEDSEKELGQMIIATKNIDPYLGAALECRASASHSYILFDYEHLRVVDLLLVLRADPNCLGEDGLTPLTTALLSITETKMCGDVLRRLLQKRADPNLQNGFDQTPLEIARIRDSQYLCAILVAAGADNDDEADDEAECSCTPTPSSDVTPDDGIGRPGIDF